MVAPAQGKIIVNRQRAMQLGLDLAGKNFIEEFVEEAAALAPPPATHATPAPK